MSFIPPALASPLPDPFDPRPGEYAAEEKYDGIRLCVKIGGRPRDLLDDRPVVAYSRYGNVINLPAHLVAELQAYPDGTFDGELYRPGKRSYGAKALVNQAHLVLAVFDVLEVAGRSCADVSYDDRRLLLAQLPVAEGGSVLVAQSVNVETWDDVVKLREHVWAADGEGLILKRRTSTYRVGKRTKDWLKIKQLRSAVLTVVGFQAGRGTKVNRGPYAMVVLRDGEGHTTTVKTKNDATLRELERQGDEALRGKFPDFTPLPHPALGRQLRIEYQERTPDGSYRHPRWDRWENE